MYRFMYQVHVPSSQSIGCSLHGLDQSSHLTPGIVCYAQARQTIVPILHVERTPQYLFPASPSQWWHQHPSSGPLLSWGGTLTLRMLVKSFTLTIAKPNVDVLLQRKELQWHHLRLFNQQCRPDLHLRLQNISRVFLGKVIQFLQLIAWSSSKWDRKNKNIRFLLHP
jgi:hypothetical protein